MPRIRDEHDWSFDRKLNSLILPFRLKVAGIILALEGEGYEPDIWYAVRGEKTQARLVAAGVSWTMDSKHFRHEGEGEAVDLIDKRFAWGDWDPRDGEGTPEAKAAKRANAEKFFTRLGALAEGEGLVWGGRWKGKQRDAAHVETMS